MSDELTAETIDTDNSNDIAGENTEPSENNSDDNSDNGTQEPVKSNEAENNDGAEAKDKSKFSTLEEAVKSYSELEKKLGQQSNELGELRRKAQEADEIRAKQLDFIKSYGFNSIEEFENHQQEQQDILELAQIESDLFAQHINEVNILTK